MTDITTEKLLKIGELAKETGETVATIRFWTTEGILHFSARTPGRYRLYDRSSIDRVKLIQKFKKEQRLTIPEIRERLANNG